MILNIWRYAYGGAKVMALKSYLLSPEDYHYLLRARNLEDLVGYLLTTAYGQTLSGWDWHRPDAEAELSRRLYGNLAQAFLKVRRGLKKRESRFLDLLLYRLVAENLKVVLRALNLGLDPGPGGGAAVAPDGLIHPGFSGDAPSGDHPPPGGLPGPHRLGPAPGEGVAPV